MNETGNSNRTLEMCEFRFRFMIGALWNDYVHDSLRTFTKLYTLLRNLVGSTTGVQRQQLEVDI